MKNLVNLRHLELKGLSKLTHMPSGLGQLTNLQTLSQFVLTAGTKFRHNIEVGELKELMLLNNLRGDLWIKNLHHGKDVIDANLKEKQQLRSLRLGWYSPNYEVEVMEIVDHEMTLEGLQPHPNLKDLRLYGYRGVNLSSWLPTLKQLVSFTLKGCLKCQNLPPLDQFPSLKSLTLHDVPALEYISKDFVSSSINVPLPSLVHLSLKKLPSLKGWWKDIRNGESNNCSGTNTMPLMVVANYSFLSFPCISSLHIEDCPKLKFIPFSPFIKSLTLENSIWKPFNQTMMSITIPQTQTTTDETPSSSSSSSAFITSSFSCLISNLEHLCLSNIEDLQSLPSWLKYLGSLKSLRIKKCPKLKYLSPGTQHLVSLEYLYIEDCNELDMCSADVVMWKELKSLHSLQMYGLPQLKTLPEGLQHVNTLQLLFVGGCNSLMAIPESIRNLTSLSKLIICECPNLGSLPEGLQSISSLQVLNIWNCPILSQRCQKDKGEDWPKIAHIPNLQFEFVDDSQSSAASVVSVIPPQQCERNFVDRSLYFHILDAGFYFKSFLWMHTQF
nr:disease resistance protein RGA2-like [Ziziphus jujuba var. spinosa]